MFNLDQAGMHRWLAVMPADIKSCLGDEGSIGDGVLVNIVADAVRENRPDTITSILPEYISEFSAWGRARRLRLMAWVVNSSLKSGDNYMRTMAELIGEDDEGNGGSSGETSAIMYTDFMALKTALGNRTIRSVLNLDSMDDALSTVVELRDEMGMGMGGMP